jgi:antitoxin HicB
MAGNSAATNADKLYRTEVMKKRKISKKKMALPFKTSRTQVDLLLDAKNDITLSNLQRAAAIVGRRVAIELV